MTVNVGPFFLYSRTRLFLPLTKGKVINVFCYFVPHVSRTLSQIISPLQLGLI